jgi:hypothetical protein
LASFGHGENSPSKIVFGCDSTKKDSLVRAVHSIDGMNLPAKNDAPTQVWESIRTAMWNAWTRYFMPPTSSQIL